MRIIKPYLPAAVLAVSVAACAGSPDPTPTTTRPELVDRIFDLTDPVIQAEVGAPPFEPVGWQRFVGPLTAVGDTALPDPREVEIIAAAAADAVPQLLDGVRNLVRTSDAPPSHLDTSAAVAVAVGPDIYLLDRVFSVEARAGRYQVAYAINHELTHVQQWLALDDAYLNAAARGEVDAIELDSGSDAVRAFAAATGWTDTGDEPWQAQWVIDSDSVPATEYGTAGPAEDMAETVALAASGRSNWLDPARRVWLSEWLGAPLTDLDAGQPFVPEGASEVNSADLLYDEEAVAAQKGERRRVEPLYFQLPADVDAAEVLATDIAEELGRRGLTGTMATIDDERLMRFGGSFERGDGVGFRVELWDFRTSTFERGPGEPILSYVMIW